MRLTVVHKTLGSIGAIIGLGLLSMMTIYNGLASMKQALHIVIDVEEPASAAAYEMEINVIGTGMGVLKYLDTGDARYRDRVAKDEADFERFLVQFQRLADTAQEQALGEKVARLYKDYRATGETLITKKDEQEALFAAVGENFERMHAILNEMINVTLAAQNQADVAKVMTAMAMNIDIAEVGSWLGNYLRTLKPQYRERFLADAGEFQEVLARFQQLDLSEQEQRQSAEVQAVFQEIQDLFHDILGVSDTLQEKVPKFLNLRAELDDTLDDQIQARRWQDLNAAKESADRAAASVLRTAGVLSLAFILLSLAAAFLTIRNIRQPLQALENGTAAVTEGDLSYRLPVKGRDEFAEVTTRFNHMIAELEATTVSKKRLEENQQKLKQVNAYLQEEIASRERTEEALQALSQQLLKAQETERRRIARELHDEIGQALNAVRVNLEAIQLKPDPATQGRRLRDTISVVDTTLQQVRDLSLDLRPSLLDDLGLASALRWHVDQQAQRVGFLGRFIGNSVNMPLDPDVQVACFRIVQEALSNVAQHARAQHVTVELRRHDRELRLSVRDDGIGFDVDRARQSALRGASMGLLGMQERALLAGGRLEIQSVPGRGSEVRVRLPLG